MDSGYRRATQRTSNASFATISDRCSAFSRGWVLLPVRPKTWLRISFCSCGQSVIAMIGQRGKSVPGYDQSRAICLLIELPSAKVAAGMRLTLTMIPPSLRFRPTNITIPMPHSIFASNCVKLIRPLQRFRLQIEW